MKVNQLGMKMNDKAARKNWLAKHLGELTALQSPGRIAVFAVGSIAMIGFFGWLDYYITHRTLTTTIAVLYIVTMLTAFALWVAYGLRWRKPGQRP
jgi:membrane-bound metal-dependent hydrolase YbcI (DUF457 family)